MYRLSVAVWCTAARTTGAARTSCHADKRSFGVQSCNAVSVDADVLLASAGWYPGRVVDVSEAERAWLAEGCTVHDEGPALLREFSGLTVWAADKRRSLWFDGERALRDIDPAWCRAYSEDSGRLLLPVGGYSHMVLLVDEVGGLWGGFDAEYGQLADSVTEAVRVLLIDPGSRHFDRRLPDGR
jgi:hypothetical protein